MSNIQGGGPPRPDPLTPPTTTQTPATPQTGNPGQAAQASPTATTAGATLKHASGADLQDEFVGKPTDKPATTESHIIEDKYAATKDAGPLLKRFLKWILKIMWSMGGAPDSVDKMPRLRGEDVRPILKDLKPGDIILNGNGGGLTHAAMYIGNGEIVHSMATHDTMRGTGGSIWDSVKRAFGAWPKEEKTGVLQERFDDFLDRYERDTYVICRQEDLNPEQVAKGVEHIKTLVGKGYDYDFSAGDDEYYCTEIIMEYLDTAMGKKNSTVFNTEHYDYGVFETDAVSPETMLQHTSLTPIAANDAATGKFGERIEGAPIYGQGGEPTS